MHLILGCTSRRSHPKAFWWRGDQPGSREAKLQASGSIKMEDVFNNSNLFSNHYLESMIQKSAEWEDESGLALAYR
ncbi:MAG: hypothetical protein WAZ20_10880, partial [Methanothrix sp.]|uniref:hypothetical protein n=1 Tax=Methanothrix sp. TaxID=90426 RepID=UPI003BB7EB41